MPKIQTDFVVSGERAYKQAVSEINSGLGVLNSEMKRVTAQFQENAGSVDALRARGDVLERQLLSEQEKVEKLREALEHAKREYGEADKRTMEWQKSLNNAQAAVANTEHAIRENNKALEDAERGMQDTGETSEKLSLDIKDLASQFGIRLPAGLDKALGGMKGFSTGSVAAVAGVTAAVSALIALYRQLIDLTVESAAKADDILTMAQITGLSTDTIQEMRYAANLIDVSFETVRRSMTKLKNNMQDAANGNKKLMDTFAMLGVEVTNADGSLRDSEAVFYDIIDALGEIENQTERDAVAMDLFGRSAEELNPLIIQGSGRMRELAEEAHKVNYVMGEEGLEALGAVDDAYQRLQKTQESIKDQMAADMAPAVEELYTKWTEFIIDAAKELKDSGIIEGAAAILESVVDLIPALGELTHAVLPDLGDGLQDIADVVHVIGYAVAGISDFVDIIGGLYPWNWGSGKLTNALGYGYSSGNPSHIQAYDMKVTGSYGAYQDRYSGNENYDDWTYSPATGQYESSYGIDYYDQNTGQYTRYYPPGGAENAFYNPKTGKWYDRTTGWEIPGYATGTMHFVGGRARVGENGPEVVELPEGARIWNAQDSRRGAGGSSIHIDTLIVDAKNVKELNDLVSIVEDLPAVRRMR